MVQSVSRMAFVVVALACSIGASAADHSPQAAVDIFLKDVQVKAAISQLESKGYSKDGEASAAVFQYSFGDEGYLVRYLVSVPMAMGSKPWEKTVTLISAKVSIDAMEGPTVELVDTIALGDALIRLR